MKAIENWLREPPEWFLNMLAGVGAGGVVLGLGMMTWAVAMLAQVTG